MKKGMLPFILGITLLLLSFPPNFSSIRESFYKQSIHKQYEMNKVTYMGTSYFIEDNGNFGIESVGSALVEEENQLRDPIKNEIQLVDAQLNKIGEKGIFEQTFNYNDQIIKIRDQSPLKKPSDPANIFPETALFPIEIIVNDRSFQNTMPTTFHPGDFEDGRYLNELGLLLIKNLSTNKESLLIIQRFGKDWPVEESRWKFLWVSKEGQTKVETFDNTERKAVPYRTAFINEASVTPTWLGYKMDEVTYYPTYLYPFLYPWLTTILGLLLTIFGSIRRFFFTKSSAV